jgi:murein DD-endopeptidase MepM/ murein hydrolase activator NlpD
MDRNYGKHAGEWHKQLLQPNYFRAAIVILAFLGLFWTAPFTHASVLDDIKTEIQQKEEEIRKLEQDKTAYQKTVTDKQKAQKTLKNQIAILEADISKLKVQMQITSANISKTELNIKALGMQITSVEGEIVGHMASLKGIMRILAQDSDSQKTMLALMLKEDPFSIFLSQLAYTESLENEVYRHTESLKTNRDELLGDKTDLAEQKNELETLKNRLVAESAAKDDQQKKKSDTLASAKSDEKKYKQLLTNAEKQRQDILKDIKELEDKLRRTIDPASLPASRPGVIDWPAKGVVSQEYGNTKDTGFINDSYDFHNGIDIANDTGTPIKAARDGVVKAIGSNGQYAYGNWIAIEHDDNLTTLYCHLSAYAGLKQGSAVKKGQIIGYMGATGYATGPHLHLTVYASNTFITEKRWFGLLPLGGSINPRNYLP